jgi:hypothetical protein
MSNEQLQKNLFSKILSEMQGNYDPSLIGAKNNICIDPSEWP